MCTRCRQDTNAKASYSCWKRTQGNYNLLQIIPVTNLWPNISDSFNIECLKKQYKSLSQSCVVIAKEEGIKALWKGITPRLLRIMPGQAITFMTYEAVSTQMDKLGWFD